MSTSTTRPGSLLTQVDRDETRIDTPAKKRRVLDGSLGEELAERYDELVDARCENAALREALDRIHKRLCEARSEPAWQAISSHEWCVDECRTALGLP